MIAAIGAIEPNITVLSPLVLPISEQIHYAINCILRRLHVANIKPYIPDLKKAFDHIFPHVGGKSVLDELQRSVGFSKADMEAS